MDIESSRSTSLSPRHITRRQGRLSSMPPSGGTTFYNKNNQKRTMFNLEIALQVEKLFDEILGQLRQGRINQQTCDQYWLLTDQFSLAQTEGLFRESRVRTSIRQSAIVEYVSIKCIEIYSRGEMPPDVTQILKNLMFNIHQSYLQSLAFIKQRVAKEMKSNSWYLMLSKTLDEKLSRQIKPQERAMYLKKLVEISVNFIQNIDAIIKSPLSQWILSMVQSLDTIQVAQVRKILEEFIADDFLQPLTLDANELLPESPFLPPVQGYEYTLVLDLDETLVHYVEVENEGFINIRPGCEEFLQTMANYYEIVIFTAGLQDYADWAIAQIDQNNYIKYRLYRQHTIQSNLAFAKDLSRLGRDLKKTLIIDNLSQNFQLQPDNGIYIKSWYDDQSDDILIQFIPLLTQLVQQKVQDIPLALRQFRDTLSRMLIQGIKQPHLSFSNM